MPIVMFLVQVVLFEQISALSFYLLLSTNLIPMNETLMGSLRNIFFSPWQTYNLKIPLPIKQNPYNEGNKHNFFRS